MRSRLPPADINVDADDISATQLHHLLRLSALPPPTESEQESKMLATLRSQIAFVREMQTVDTTGVSPLRRISDETTATRQETEIGLDTLAIDLGAEEMHGLARRIQKQSTHRSENIEAEDWDSLGQASKRVGKFFVVKSGPA